MMKVIYMSAGLFVGFLAGGDYTWRRVALAGVLVFAFVAATFALDMLHALYSRNRFNAPFRWFRKGTS